MLCSRMIVRRIGNVAILHRETHTGGTEFSGPPYPFRVIGWLDYVGGTCDARVPVGPSPENR